MIAEGLFTYRLKRRRHFAIRLIVALLLDAAAALFYPVLMYNAAYSTAMFLVLFAVSVLSLKILFSESWTNILFCGLIAYTTQHLAYDVYNLLGVVTGLSRGISFYGQELIGESNGFLPILYVDSYIVIYWLMWFICGFRIKREDIHALKSLSMMGLAALILLVDVILSLIMTYSVKDDTETLWIVLCYLYNILSCLLAAFLQFYLVFYRKQELELKTVQNLLYQKEEQYKISKDTIDIINIKCHDLKHQIRTLRHSDGEIDKEALREVENAVGIYDAAVKTGNEALDIILTEKSLYCEKNEIKLCCVADGNSLSFMTPTDIYSLFGNALENAVEAVAKIEDKNRRAINLTIKSVGKLLSVHIDNYYEEEPLFRDGLPQSRKGDSRYHGYGVSSMRYIAEKYGGEIAFKSKAGVFELNMLFPLKG